MFQNCRQWPIDRRITFEVTFYTIAFIFYWHRKPNYKISQHQYCVSHNQSSNSKFSLLSVTCIAPPDLIELRDAPKHQSCSFF